MPSGDKTIYSKTGGQFLRPFSVGSSVHWFMHVEVQTLRYGSDKGKQQAAITGQVRLTDCEKHIDWFVSDDEDIEKLDRAIMELKAARSALLKARTVYKEFKAAHGNNEDDDL